MADRYGAVILAPNATGNLYGAHCWDWAAANRSRSYGHSAVLLELVGRFTSNPQYGIDPGQVYVAGLSSGGAKTMMLGCQAPDVFAGVGINAGPPPGVSSGQIGRVPPGFSATTAAGNCTALAGAHAGHFTTQVASVIWGSSDFLVAPAYGPLAAAAMRQVYGGTFTRGPATGVPMGGSNLPSFDANGKLRTSEIVVAGMAHAWPAGPGGQAGNFVDNSKVDYPAFVMDFWFRNNLRAVASGGVPTLQPPTGLALDARSADSITLSWHAANDATGYHLYRDDARINSAPLTATHHIDGGLASNTSYTYQVSSSAGTEESAKSARVTASTASCFTCTAATATNTAHVQAGRAYNSGIYAFAKGSHLIIGLDSSSHSSTLAQIAPGYYILGNCP